MVNRVHREKDSKKKKERKKKKIEIFNRDKRKHDFAARIGT